MTEVLCQDRHPGKSEYSYRRMIVFLPREVADLKFGATVFSVSPLTIKLHWRHL